MRVDGRRQKRNYFVALIPYTLYMRQLFFISVIMMICLAMPGLVWSADEGLEPEVTIIQKGENVIEEYRLNGNLYMIKVTPTKGRPYYLVDSDGDGSLDVRRNNIEEDIAIPRWTIFEW